MSERYYDIDKMTDIIFTLKEKFSNDRIIYFLLDRLIRNESDHLPLLHKSSGVLELEKSFNVSIVSNTG